MEKPRSRKVFKRIDDDVASLYVHRSSDSFVSQLTDTLTKISRDFAFDRLLWVSKVYKDASPGLLELMRERVGRRELTRVEEQASRSKTIDTQLKKELAGNRTSTKILVLGFDKSLVSCFINSIKMDPMETKSLYTLEYIQQIMDRAVIKLIEIAEPFVLNRDLAIGDCFEPLDIESQTSMSTNATNARARAVQSLWANGIFKAAMLEEGYPFPSWAEWAEWYLSLRKEVFGHS